MEPQPLTTPRGPDLSSRSTDSAPASAQDPSVSAGLGRPGSFIHELLCGPTPLSARTFWSLAILISLIAFGLRLITLHSRPLELDETYSVWFASRPWHELWHVVPLYETHPPMYYSILKIWMGWFGETEVALRILSVLAGVATILLVAVSGKLLRAGPQVERAGLIASIFLSVNKGNVLYTELARPYAIETLTTAIAILCSVIVLRHLISRQPAAIADSTALKTGAANKPALFRPAMIGLTLSASLTLWSHNTAVLVVFGIGLGLLVSVVFWTPGNRLRSALTIAAPFVIALALWSPYVSFLLLATKHVQSAFWVKFSWFEFSTAWSLAAGGKLPMVPVFVLCAAGYIGLWRSCRPVAVHLAILLLVPFLITLAFSYFIRPVFIDRLFEWMVTPILFLAALGFVWAMPRNLSRAAVLVAVLLLAGAQTMMFYLTKPQEDFRASVAEVANHYQSGDLLVLVPNDTQVAVQYYAKNFAKLPDLLVVPSPFPATDMDRPYPSNLAAPGIVPADRDLVKQALATHHRVWLIQRGADLYDPDSLIRNEILSLRKPVQVHDDHTPELWPELFE
ncbi:mannosyltransferase [Paraburkholderia sp. GAS333]|uniref:glycosyltransferase family 39 protein n=1 Tax=Paraburkholderia sp. GAS333 TaxID=3156279 RepID=UPI003D196988